MKGSSSADEGRHDLDARYTDATFVNMSMSVLGLIDEKDSANSNLTVLFNIGVSKVTATNPFKSAAKSYIPSYYYLFSKDKNWIDLDFLAV